jgi:hypothetical protein
VEFQVLGPAIEAEAGVGKTDEAPEISVFEGMAIMQSANDMTRQAAHHES